MDLFLDIETVRECKTFAEATERVQKLFTKRFFSDFYQKQNPDVTIEERWKDQAGLTAEFGIIVCLSISYFDEAGIMYTRNYTGPEHTDEKTGILDKFLSILKSRTCRLIAHNGKNFDFPILTRRMMIHGLEIPAPLNTYRKKPWEVFDLIDTVELWASTEYKPFISLDTLCELLGVESPKEGEVNGANLGDYYWDDPAGSIHKIAEYCGSDTVALANVFLILMRLLRPPITK